MTNSLPVVNDYPVAPRLSFAMLALITGEFALAEFAGVVSLAPRLHSLPALRQFNLIASLVLLALPWAMALVGHRAASRQAGLFKDVLDQTAHLRLWNVRLAMVNLAYVVFFAGLSLGSAH